MFWGSPGWHMEEREEYLRYVPKYKHDIEARFPPVRCYTLMFGQPYFAHIYASQYIIDWITDSVNYLVNFHDGSEGVLKFHLAANTVFVNPHERSGMWTNLVCSPQYTGIFQEYEITDAIFRIAERSQNIVYAFNASCRRLHESPHWHVDRVKSLRLLAILAPRHPPVFAGG